MSKIFWAKCHCRVSAHVTAINNANDNYQLSYDVQSLILPGTIKQLRSDGTVRAILNRIEYDIDEVDGGSSRKELRYLTTITVLPDVYKINFNLNAAPSVMNLNLFEGLQELELHGYVSPTDTDRRNINLIVPSSVKKCK